jgi:hypothetical protein
VFPGGIAAATVPDDTSFDRQRQNLINHLERLAFRPKNSANNANNREITQRGNSKITAAVSAA